MSDRQSPSSDPSIHPGQRAAVITALVANVAVAIAKLGVFAITSSSAMLAEALHSFADSANEVLLLVGARRSTKPADGRHPFGHTRYRYLYAYVVSLTVFWIGGVLAVIEGVNHLASDESIVAPAWAFAWAGGLAIAQFLQEHPDEVQGKRVVDFATGSGLCAIVAMRQGAASSVGIDVDPFAEAAVALNARANGVRVGFVGRDVLDDDPPEADVLLAGDTWYESPLAERVLPWLHRAAANGTRVLVGDPGRRYVPADDLVPLAAYDVQTTTQLEDRAVVRGRVFTLPGSP